jgi:hypothetical protein
MNASRISFARASRAERIPALAFALATILLAACSRGAAPSAEPPADAAPATAPMAPVDAAPAIDSAAPVAAADDSLSAFASAAPVSGKSIGHTSVVFKLRLEGGAEAAFKPKSKRGPTRYRGEVAAYRLAMALGLPNVPPAILRSFDKKALGAALAGEPLFEREAIAGADGAVIGALMPWIKGLEFLELEKDPWLARWQGWLARGGVIADGERSLASQISTMIVFDYITGNWDRWSGGNVGTDRAKTRVLYIDNDGAFYDPPPAPALARQLGILKKVDRYSRAFVGALRTVDVAKACGDESPGVPLLTARIAASVDERRKKALAIIDEKIAAIGEAGVLAFE